MAESCAKKAHCVTVHCNVESRLACDEKGTSEHFCEKAVLDF